MIQKHIFYIEVRDSQTGYLLPVRDAQGTLPDVESCWDAAAVAAAAAVAVAAAAPHRPVPPVPKMDSFANVPRQQGAFTRLPCSFFQEHVPKMDSFANVLDSKELLSISGFKTEFLIS